MTVQSEPVFFDAVLRPNPPMKPRALLVVLMAVLAVNLAFALYFVSRGAWPITPFMGADVLLLAWAFHASRVAARRFEHLRLTHALLSVSHHPPRGRPRESRFNPYWVRVRAPEPDVIGAPLLLVSHGQSLRIASFLGAQEKLSLAQALKEALQKAREFREN
ncbi:MAG: DUF2244 domain-containing protein [Proteobacteria bacterium]|nr:DUF2244 domain-containing protein [Pseudomonadota bacterium]